MKSIKNIIEVLGFNEQTLRRFIIVAVGSQVIYSYLAIRSVLYDQVLEFLGVTNTQFGILMGLTGVGIFGAVLLGFVQNRFSSRAILTFGLVMNALCIYAIGFLPLTYHLLLVIYFIMGFQAAAFYWPSVLNSVRTCTTDAKQGTAFGLLELIRRTTEMLCNALAVGIFSYFGNSMFGIKFIIISCAVGISICALLNYRVADPMPPVGEIGENKTKVAIENWKIALKLPEVYLVGITAAGIYSGYVGLQYFLPFLSHVFVLPAVYAAIFGIVNTSFTGMIASPISGFLADNVFKSPIKYLAFVLTMLTGGILLLMSLPRTEDMLAITMGLLIVLAFFLYLGRGVYYAPLAELKLPKEIASGAMSIASFLGYSPMFFAYMVYGYQMDKYADQAEAFQHIFIIMLTFTMIGVCSAIILSYRLYKRKKNQPSE